MSLPTEIARARLGKAHRSEPQVSFRSISFGSEGERVVSLQTVEGVLLIGTDRRVIEYDPKTERRRTLAVAEAPYG